MALKLRIFKSFSAAYKELYVRRRDIVSIVWFPLFLIVLLPLPFYLHEGFSNFAADYENQFEYFGYAIEEIMAAIFFVAVYRLVILDEKPSFRMLPIKRGVENAKVLNIKFYFRFGKRELVYGMASVFFAFIIMGAEDLFKQIKINQLRENDVYDFSLLPWYDSIFYFSYIFALMWIFLGALTLLVWPYLSITHKISFPEILNFVRSVWGNILRIMAVLFLLYLPHYGLGFLPLYMYAQNLAGFLPEGMGFIIPYSIDTFFTILEFVCALAVVIFASHVWTGLRINSKTGSPA